MKRCAAAQKRKDFPSVRYVGRCISPGPATISGALGRLGSVSPRTSASRVWCGISTGKAPTRDTDAALLHRTMDQALETNPSVHPLLHSD